MKLIKPIEMTSEKIVSSNVIQSLPIWNATSTYSKGEKVVLDAFGMMAYESLSDNNINQLPETSPTAWLATGASNPAAMFDAKNGTQTVNPNSIEVAIQTNELINAIGIINIDAKSVTVRMVNNDVVVYEKTVSTKGKPSGSWYQFYFSDFVSKDNLVDIELPAYRNASVTVIVENQGGIAKVGTLALGTVEVIGDANWGLKLGFTDYSKKDKDDYGNYTIVERAYSNNLDVSVDIETSRISAISRIRKQLRAKPVVWIGATSYEDSIVFGFFSGFDINLSSPIKSNVTISINGLT